MRIALQWRAGPRLRPVARSCSAPPANPTSPYSIALQSLHLRLHRSFDALDSLGLKMRPYIKFSDLTTGDLLAKIPEMRVQQASDGKGVEASHTFSAGQEVLLDIYDESEFSVGIEVYLKHSMRQHTLCGKDALPAETVFGAMADNLEGIGQVFTKLYKSKDGQGPWEQTGELKITFATAHSSSNAAQWPAVQVRHWLRAGRMPRAKSLEECVKAVATLASAPGPGLEADLLATASELAVEEASQIIRQRTDAAIADVKNLVASLVQLDVEARKSVTFHAAFKEKLANILVRVSHCLLEAAIKSGDQNRMRVALLGARDLGNQNSDSFAACESALRQGLRFPDGVPLDELLDGDGADSKQRQPAKLGFELAEGHAVPIKVDEQLRYSVRDETAQRVMTLLGSKVRLDCNRGVSYETVAGEYISDPKFRIPGLVRELMSRVVLFSGVPEPDEVSYAELMSMRRQFHGCSNTLLGRFDLVAQPVRVEYGADFKALVHGAADAGGFGGCFPGSAAHRRSGRTTPNDCVVGGPGWFWVLHGAAINIGESENAQDLYEYSVAQEQVPVSNKNSGRPTGKLRPRRALDEDKYVRDMCQQWRGVFQGAKHLQIEDLILFPFGMGAFLRHLHRADPTYTDEARMRRLRSRVVEGLFDVASGCLEHHLQNLRVHICLMDSSLESRVNHNVFIDCVSAKAKQAPILKSHVKFYRNVDALALAHRLASEAPNYGDNEIRRVMLLNGANRKLLGNHWFLQGAQTAIDENLHRRSAAMCLGSLLLNGGTVPCPRSRLELAETVRNLGGKVFHLRHPRFSDDAATSAASQVQSRATATSPRSQSKTMAQTLYSNELVSPAMPPEQAVPSRHATRAAEPTIEPNGIETTSNAQGAQIGVHSAPSVVFVKKPTPQRAAEAGKLSMLPAEMKAEKFIEGIGLVPTIVPLGEWVIPTTTVNRPPSERVPSM